jgi:hypothetical protein
MLWCLQCGGRWDRPGLFGCEHAVVPDTAQKIVTVLESDMNNRKGMGLDCLDRETAWEIRDTWAELIRGVLRENGSGGDGSTGVTDA